MKTYFKQDILLNHPYDIKDVPNYYQHYNLAFH